MQPRAAHFIDLVSVRFNTQYSVYGKFIT